MPAKQTDQERKRQKIIKHLCDKHPDEVIRALLEAAFWPKDLAADVLYERYEDDSRLGRLGVAFSRDGDAHAIPEPDPKEQRLVFRFRTYGGGGQSMRVRTALTILAVAIKLDNEERPQER
jgi:hypothetical protein